MSRFEEDNDIFEIADDCNLKNITRDKINCRTVPRSRWQTTVAKWWTVLKYSAAASDALSKYSTSASALEALSKYSASASALEARSKYSASASALEALSKYSASVSAPKVLKSSWTVPRHLGGQC